MDDCFEHDGELWRASPGVLIVPGLHDSGPHHWQTFWHHQYRDAERVELGMWDDPHRNTWVNQLNLAIRRNPRPVVLVAHSLGCLAVSWWAQLEQPRHTDQVIGALLVAPPDVERADIDHRLARFAPYPRLVLPFASLVVASSDDPYCSLSTAQQMAADWGSRFQSAGALGHINSASNLGDWPAGQALLEALVRENFAMQDNSRGDFDQGSIHDDRIPPRRRIRRHRPPKDFFHSLLG